jgi:hypothetical protein
MREVGFSEEAEEHFFAAMNEGFVSRETKQGILEMPGSNLYEYRRGLWRVLDTYITTPYNGRSGGSTFIWYDSVPVWMMQYLGEYSQAAIPCLLVALAANYKKRIFHGGRGPAMFKDDAGYTYHNDVLENDFERRVSGKEFIYGPDLSESGWHQYQALWLVS